MIEQPARPRKIPWKGEFFSPTYFLVRALTLSALFLLVHLAGLREHTTFLSGTPGEAETGLRLSAFYGMVYILLYLGCVVVAPILLLTAGLLAAWQKHRRKASGATAIPLETGLTELKGG